ncbi:shematrin-like protein 1 [Penaeus chinensis]|uniref:shematrin-like protein 1 n=1 Tax=Penaeus chinensis TaxID=139456 RepID=UPI001FB6AFDB|nr:shematrin-like protein 1 [Penaeus chinensis]
MKFLAVVLLAALACASPVEKRKADADPSFPIYGHGYGYPAYYRGYGYPSSYGIRLHKRSADPEPEADAEPSYLYSHHRPYSVGHSYVRPYTYGHSHALYKRSAEPEAEASVVYPHTYSYNHATPYAPYGYPYSYGYGYGRGYGY